MNTQAILIDGAPAATISVADRGLQYGDGLFETMTSVDGRVRWLDRHFARLRRGCERLEIPFEHYADLAREAQACAAGTDRAIIKLTVTRGDALARGYGFQGDELPRRIVQSFSWPADRPAAARVDFANLKASEQPALAGLKHLNRLENVLARREAMHRDLDEVLMCTPDERLVGGAMTNVFLLQGERLSTPRVDRCGVAGITRELLLENAKSAGFVCEERDVRRQEVDAADAVFLTNVRVGVWPVKTCGRREWRDSPRLEALCRIVDESTHE